MTALPGEFAYGGGFVLSPRTAGGAFPPGKPLRGTAKRRSRRNGPSGWVMAVIAAAILVGGYEVWTRISDAHPGQVAPPPAAIAAAEAAPLAPPLVPELDAKKFTQ